MEEALEDNQIRAKLSNGIVYNLYLYALDAMNYIINGTTVIISCFFLGGRAPCR